MTAPDPERIEAIFDTAEIVKNLSTTIVQDGEVYVAVKDVIMFVQVMAEEVVALGMAAIAERDALSASRYGAMATGLAPILASYNAILVDHELDSL